jgi:hypothetical protein
MSRDLLAEGIALIKARNMEDARHILAALLREQPRNELAWLWMGVCAVTTEQKIYCVKRALALNPSRVESNKTLDSLMELLARESKQLAPKFVHPAQEESPKKVIVEWKYAQPPKKPERDQKLSNPLRKSPTTEVEKTTNSQSWKDKAQQQDKTIAASKVGTTTRKSDESTTIKPAKPIAIPTPISGIDEVKKSPGANRKTKPKRATPDKNNALARKKKQPRKNSGVPDHSAHKPKEIVIPPKEPEVIQVRPEDNLFAEDGRSVYLPDGLTGFYGRTLIVDGLPITPYDMPVCLKKGVIFDRERCELCDFFSFEECVIRRDPYLFEEAKFFFQSGQERREQYLKHRKQSIKAVYDELSAHGRPLHYEVIARIVADRYPKLMLRPGSVLKIMYRNPKHFESLGNGVFRHRRSTRG